MSDLERARELAKTMVGIGLGYGVNTIALITDMTQPLENEVGNANDIAESIAVLRGEGPSDVTELTMALGEVMLELGDVEGGRDRLTEAITSGTALQKFIDVTVAHGGDPAVIDDPSLLAQAPNEAVITASVDGYVTRCDALAIGIAATRLGAGRERKEEIVDPGVEITLQAKIGA
jgi:thymidine phosphorylase